MARTFDDYGEHELCVLDDITLIRETENAYLVEVTEETFEEPARTAWLPKSQTRYDQDEKCFTLPNWLAEQKELV